MTTPPQPIPEGDITGRDLIRWCNALLAYVKSQKVVYGPGVTGSHTSQGTSVSVDIKPSEINASGSTTWL